MSIALVGFQHNPFSVVDMDGIGECGV